MSVTVFKEPPTDPEYVVQLRITREQALFLRDLFMGIDWCSTPDDLCEDIFEALEDAGVTRNEKEFHYFYLMSIPARSPD